MIFQGIRTSIAKKPYIFVIFQGGVGGLDPLCTPLDLRMLDALILKFHFIVLASYTNVVLMVKVASEGSSKRAYLCSLAGAFTAKTHKVGI